MSLLSRRQSFVGLGCLLMLIGGLLRSVESATLTPTATRILANITGPASDSRTPVRKTMQPPPWIGWMLLSLGFVLIASGLRPSNKLKPVAT